MFKIWLSHEGRGLALAVGVARALYMTSCDNIVKTDGRWQVRVVHNLMNGLNVNGSCSQLDRLFTGSEPGGTQIRFGSFSWREIILSYRRGPLRFLFRDTSATPPLLLAHLVHLLIFQLDRREDELFLLMHVVLRNMLRSDLQHAVLPLDPVDATS